ncbi:unnamed protein product, partial [Amoebophrya sp. A25]
ASSSTEEEKTSTGRGVYPLDRYQFKKHPDLGVSSLGQDPRVKSALKLVVTKLLEGQRLTHDKCSRTCVKNLQMEPHVRVIRAPAVPGGKPLSDEDKRDKFKVADKVHEPAYTS